jgi:hypothetical protein
VGKVCQQFMVAAGRLDASQCGLQPEAI